MKKSKLKRTRKIAMLLSAALLVEQPAIINPVLYVHAQEEIPETYESKEDVVETKENDFKSDAVLDVDSYEITTEDVDSTEVTSIEVEPTEVDMESISEEDESYEESTDSNLENIFNESASLIAEELLESQENQVIEENPSVQETELDILEKEADPSSNDVTKHFIDIPEGEWFVSAVQFVFDEKIMNGVSETSFAPKMTLTREQFITVLYNMEGAPKTAFKKVFEDVTDETSWFAKSVTWASENEITSGVGENNFGVGVEITREQLATLLYNYSQQKDKDGMSVDENAVADFPDVNQISSWASVSMKWAVTNGVMKGKAGNDGKNYLDPGGKASRAECAQMIKNFIDACANKEKEHNYQDGSAIIKVEGFDEKDSMIVTDEKITLKGTVSNPDEITEFTCSMHSVADGIVKKLEVNGMAEWTVGDISLDIGTNYISFVVKNNKGEEYLKEVLVIRNSTELKAADNVVSFNVNDEEQLKDVEQIYDQILDTWRDDKGTADTNDDEICIAVNETNPLYKYILSGNIKSGDVVFIPENDYFITGFTMIYRSHDDKVIDDVKGYDTSKYEVLHMSEASIMDLIDGDISINMNEIDMDDPIAFVYNPYSEYLSDEPDVLAGAVDSERDFNRGNSNDVNGQGLQLQNLLKINPTVDFTSSGEISLGLTDLIIFDGDGDADTKGDRIVLDGGISLSEIVPTIGVEWHPVKSGDILPNQLISTIEYKESRSIKVTMGNDVAPEKMIGANFENKREELIPGLLKSVEGVDTSKTIFLTAVGLHVGGTNVELGGIQDISNASYSMSFNPVLVLSIIIDTNGETKAEVSVELKESSYIKKGINVQEDGFKGNYGSVEQNIGTDNRTLTVANKVYHINTYDIKQKSKDDSGAPQEDLILTMKGSLDMYTGVGVGIGVMVCGIMPAMVKGTVGPHLSIIGDFRGTISNYPNTNSMEILGKYIELVGSMTASLKLIARIKVEVNLKAETVAGDVSLKFTHEPPLDIELWEGMDFSTIPVNGYVYAQDYDGDESNDEPLAGAMITLKEKNTAIPKEYTATTDTDGYFEMGGVLDSFAGNYDLIVSKNGYEDYTDSTFKVEADNHKEPNKFYLDREYADAYKNVFIGNGTDFSRDSNYKNCRIKKLVIESDGVIVGDEINPFDGSLIDEVVINDGVTIIPQRLFYNAVIKDIWFPDSVTVIEKCAFYQAKLPKNFEIGRNIEDFGVECFFKAYIGDAKITIGRKMKMAVDAFAYCKIKEVNLVSEEKVETNSPFRYAIIEKVNIPDTISSIPKFMFERAIIQEIEIPGSVTEVQEYAFSNATLPEDFQISKYIKNFGNRSFAYADFKDLKITLTAGMKMKSDAFASTKIKELIIDSVKDVEPNTPFEFATIEKVSISNNVTVIPDSMFYNATIQEMKIPDSVMEVGNVAFYYAKLPQGFQLGKNIKKYGARCFQWADLSDAKITIANNPQMVSECFMYSKIKEVEFKTMPNVLGSYIFYSATVEKINISDTVTTIPKELFYQATIGEIEIPDSVTSVGDMAFFWAKLPENFKMGKGIKKFGELCFGHVDVIDSRILITDETEMGRDAFIECKVKEVRVDTTKDLKFPIPFYNAIVEKVSFSNNAKTIPTSLFEETTIKEIRIPNTLQKIGEAAFWDATLPDGFSVPEGVEIGSNAFAGSNYSRIYQ